MSAACPAHDPRSPAKRPPLAAPNPPPAAATAQPPPLLPLHLQHAVHQALTDLQAQRLLYPQQCAAAEAEGASARQEAQQRVAAALGPFSYSSALSDLDAARQAAKQLARRRLQLHSPDEGGAPAGGSLDPSLPSPAATAAAANEEEALWAGFETFSAAVSAEVDRRIATARLHPPAQAAARGERLRHLQQRHLPQQAAAVAGPAADLPASRQPLGSLQQQEARLPPTAAVKPAVAQRKRERSPQAPQSLPQAVPGGGRKGARQQAAGRQGATAQAPPAAASPSSKRPRPHVAFGTRCDVPRPALRSSRPVKLEAAGAPTPPQLPPVLPEGPAVPPARRNMGAAAAAAAAPGQPGPSTQSDLLRSLTAAVTGSKTSHDAAGPAPPPQCAAAAAEPDAAGSSGLQRMLADLTAALQGALPPAEVQLQEADSSGGPGGLPAVLLPHGIEASVLQDAGSLLQAVLDRMEGMEQRTAAVGRGSPSTAAAGGAPAAAAAGTDCRGLDQQAPHGSAPTSPSAQQLCDQFSQLLQASGAGLVEVQQQLAGVQQAEAVAQRMEAAAVQTALAGLEAAAQAAEQTASHLLAAATQPLTALPHDESGAAAPPAERRCCEGAAPLAAHAQREAEEQRRDKAQALRAKPDAAVEAASTQPASPSADTVGAAAMPGAPVSEAEQQANHAQHASEQPPTELAPASADAATAACSAAVPEAAAATDSGSCHSHSLAEPAEGWPVAWPPPVVNGIPLLLPPAAAQPQWVMPAAGGCMWQPAGALMPGAVPRLAPQLGDGLCCGQPPADSPGQQGQDAAVQWDQPFSVASDEELPDSPSSSTCASPTASAGSGSHREADELLLAANKEGDSQQAERQQAVLDELAALSIRQYQQHAYLAEDLGCRLLAAADGAWDAAAAGADSIPSSPKGPPAEQAHKQAVVEQAAAPTLGPAPAAAGGSAAAATAHPAPVTSGPAPALPSAGPAAQPVLLRPPAPYQPLKAAAEAAAAARQREEAAGWHRLRQRADELALWHEYATVLGISADELGQQQQQTQQHQAVAHRRAPPPAPLPQPAAAWAAGQRAVGSGAEGSGGAEVRVSSLPSSLHQRLWRPLDIRQPHFPEPVPARSPAALASPSLTASYDAASSSADGSGTPAGSSCLASEENSSLLSSATTSSSLGVGARHKARALRYRLLRRRLEQATGVRASLLPEECGAPSESDCLSPATDASLATPLLCKLPGGGSKQRLRRLQEEPAIVEQAVAGQLPVGMEAAVEAEMATSAAAAAEAPSPSEGSLATLAEADGEAPPAGSPSTAAAGGDSDAERSPPLDSHLADHLSSATPSDCPTLGSRVVGGMAAGEAPAAGDGEERFSGRPWRRISESSCSTLREISVADY